MTEQGLGGLFPYEIHQPLLPLFGASLQEVSGWAIVAYLGWWLGCHFSEKLFAQIAWACLFLGAISWAVESAAIAAGWWHWRVPAASPLLLGVPFIGLIDWFFVGTDFLLPFTALTAPELSGRRARWLTLLAFPAHFSAHSFVGRLGEVVPIPIYHLAHWFLVGTLLWLSTRSDVGDRPFNALQEGWIRRLPVAALAIVLIDAAAVDLLVTRRPDLLVSIAPALAVSLQALRAPLGIAAGVAGILFGLWVHPLMLAAAPPAASVLLAMGRRHGRRAPAAMLVALAAVAWGVHASGARAERELTLRLDRALAARDRGDLATARRDLEEAARAHPESHVPAALLAEIEYRLDRLGPAREWFAAALSTRQDYVEGYRHLAVIDLRRGDREEAARVASRGLTISEGDPELEFLLGRARGEGVGVTLRRLAAFEPAMAQSIASLAYELGDASVAVEILDRSMSLWPKERWFYKTRIKLALRQGDEAAARHAARVWLGSMPNDIEAMEIARQLEVQ
ncbi:MAG TPA: hypothetical protein VGK94_14300 [Candidatus Polarisedimenticolia bacterium]